MFQLKPKASLTQASQHTTLKPQHQVKFMTCLTPLVLGMAMVFSSGCTNDTANTTRIIEVPDTDGEETEVKTTAFRSILPSRANNLEVNIYDLNQDKVLASGTVSIADEPKEKDKPTNAEKGLEITFNIDNTKLQNGSLLLITTSAATTGSSTYYDPFLGQTVDFPADAPWMTLGTTTTSVPSPLTTLAVYRTMSRLGWFYLDENASKTIPAHKEIQTFLATQDSALVVAQYQQSLVEVINSLTVTSLPPIYEQADIVTSANDGTSGLADTSNWLYMLAQVGIYNQTAQSNAPFATFARDISVDFLDGDIDGQSINTVTDIPYTLTDSFIANFDSDHLQKDQRTNESIYRKQFAVLKAYEAKLLAQMNTLGNLTAKVSDNSEETIKLSDTNTFKNIIKALYNDDGAYFPISSSPVQDAPSLNNSTNASAVITPNNTDAKKMIVSYTSTDSSKVMITVVQTTETAATGDITKWSGDTPSGVNVDSNSGKVTIPRNLIAEDSEITATSFDKNGAKIATITAASNANAELTYSDHSLSRSALIKPYYGIGNHTRPVDIAVGNTSRNSLNSDEGANNPNGFPVTDLDGIIGKYTGSNCSLVINNIGEVTLTVDGTNYTTLVDRELGDNLYTTLNTDGSRTGNFVLNVSSKNNDTSERRFIQVNIEGQTPVSATTAIADSADATPLAGTDLPSCSFS